MSRCILPVLVSALLLAACARSPVVTSPSAAAPAANAVSAANAASSNAAADPPQSSTARLIDGRWLPGGNFTELVPAGPSGAPPGHVKVTEVFWYGCSHCEAFDPYVQRWLRTKPAYVDFVRVPVMWGDIHRAHARLFYTLRALGRLDLHREVFEEIQHKGDELYVSGNPRATFAAQLKFAQAHGIDAGAFNRAYNSDAVKIALQKAADLNKRDQIASVPTMVVDGRYESDPGLVGSNEKLIQWVDDFAALEERVAHPQQ